MNKAAIFDMDGVLVDNTFWHIEAWKTFCERHSMNMSAEGIISNLGNTNADYLNFLFGRTLSQDKMSAYGIEKEEIYRNIYTDHIKPLTGLMDLLDLLDKEAFSIGLATSAPSINVDFTLERLGIKNRFMTIVDVTSIKKGKPDPEIYHLAAQRLEVTASKCIVFEDSIHGIQAAVSAGMHAIGVLTSQKKEKLGMADYLISDFSEITTELLNRILRN